MQREEERDKATWRDRDRQTETDRGYVADFGPRVTGQSVHPFSIQAKCDSPWRQALAYQPMARLWPRPSDSHLPFLLIMVLAAEQAG